MGTLKALGLNRRGRTVEFEDSPQLQGQLKVITHLVKVEEV
jgi:ribosomal protein L30